MSGSHPVQEKDPADAEPGLLLAQNWENAVELSGWWLSEKLDGVRAYWDGKQFLSRQGNTFHAPDWFVEALPAEPLDGELWLGRKAFQRTVSIVRRQDKSDHWKEIKYLVFDMPAVAAPFEERMTQLRDRLVSKPSPHAAVHEQYPCQGLDHLREELTRVEALGGEGLMLREPGSLYVAGRWTTLLKVKPFTTRKPSWWSICLAPVATKAGWVRWPSSCPTARRFPSERASPTTSARTRRPRRAAFPVVCAIAPRCGASILNDIAMFS